MRAIATDVTYAPMELAAETVMRLSALATSGPFHEFGTLSEMLTADGNARREGEVLVMDAPVGVVGLGAIGSCALWRVAAQETPVLGFEQFYPGHPYGSSHGLTRLYRLAALEGPQYVPLGQLALRLWRQLEAENDAEILAAMGGLNIGSPDSEVIRGTLESVQKFDLPHELLTADELRTRYPQHAITDAEVAVIDPAAGVLRPERGINAAVQSAERQNARVVRNVRVTGIEPDADGVTVHTEARSFRVGELVLATGAWTQKLLPSPEFSHHVKRVVMSWFRPREGDAASFAPDAFPVFVRDVPDTGMGAWGVPAIDGPLVKIGPETYADHEDDPDNIDRAIYAADTAGVSEYVKRYLPGLDPRPVKVQPCMIAPSQDDHFILGRHESLPHVVLAAGLGGHGFKYATAIGDVASSLALGAGSPVPIGGFTPDRLTYSVTGRS
jgi:sarcosine oxidase